MIRGVVLSGRTHEKHLHIISKRRGGVGVLQETDPPGMLQVAGELRDYGDPSREDQEKGPDGGIVMCSRSSETKPSRTWFPFLG